MASAEPMPALGRRAVSDVAGVIVLGGCATWSVITASVSGGRPEGVLLAVLAVAAGYASGRMCGTYVPVAAPAAGALAGLGLAITAPNTAPGSQVISPLGQTGSTAALLTLSAGAACCAAWAARSPALRLGLRLLAAGIGVASAFLGSTAGCVACAGVLLCSLAADHMRRGPGLAGLALTAGLVTGATWAVAENVLPDGLTSALEGQLTQQRVQLWRDALDLAHQEPGLGVGPGRFPELSPTITQSPTADGKPYSAPFQQAAEQGLVGVVLLAAVFCWVLYALWRTARRTPVALTAGAALTALAAIAAVGNALSFPTVTAGAGLLAGLATARPLPQDRDSAVDAGRRTRSGRLGP
ncbi:O-antigen ligase family protein [Streptomyces sp. NBC_00286]|uniref:O-antigen ligase family protein n=1 Tax=Streptomyces sp. NBC_00286 TaxID=2975701 RepID=UPI002E2CF2E2|nr:hypothetical protein [Streptomyces sp. NBC_00286]